MPCKKPSTYFSFLPLLLAPFLIVPAHAAELPEFDCLIEPWHRIDVSFADRGILSEILVKQSETVEKGQPLASLASGLESATVAFREARSGMQEEISSASADYEYSQRNLKRLNDLYKKKSIPFSKLDEAQTAVTVAKHRLQQARDNNQLAKLELGMAQEVLSRRTIESPINGVVVRRYKFIGEYVEDEPVLQIAQLHPLRVEVLVPVGMFGEIEPGMMATVTPEAPMNGDIRQAQVIMVDKVVDVASGTFSVQLELDNVSMALPSGLKCGVRFTL